MNGDNDELNLGSDPKYLSGLSDVKEGDQPNSQNFLKLPELILNPQTIANLNDDGSSPPGLWFTTFGRSCFNHMQGNHSQCLKKATDPKMGPNAGDTKCDPSSTA